MITLLRDQCYHNRETGELRDTITLKDGYRELANALGIERPKTIGDWLPPLDEMARRRSQEEASTHWQKRQEKRDFVALFLEKTEHHFRPGRFGKTAQWTLKVSQGDSLIPAHALAVEPLTRLIHLAHDEDEVWVAKLLEGEWDNEFEARISRGWVNLRREIHRSGARISQVRVNLRREIHRI